MTNESTVAKTAIPARGDRLPNFSGQTTTGDDIRLRDYYMRRNLALVFTHGPACEACRQLIADLASIRTAVQAEAGEILVVASYQPENLAVPSYPIVIDQAGAIHRHYGLIDKSGHPQAAIFLGDRYGVVFETSIADEEHAMLPVDQIPGWLEFIACRCS